MSGIKSNNVRTPPAHPQDTPSPPLVLPPPLLGLGDGDHPLTPVHNIHNYDNSTPPYFALLLQPSYLTFAFISNLLNSIYSTLYNLSNSLHQIEAGKIQLLTFSTLSTHFEWRINENENTLGPIYISEAKPSALSTGWPVCLVPT